MPNLFAQDEGILHINETISIRELLDHRKSLNFQRDRKLKVWSVQLLLSRDKYLATKKVSEIKKRLKYVTSKIDWFYEAPYYRIYAGGFYTKLDAITLLNQVLESYPNAIVFKNTEAKPSDM
ncbi:MAG: sporulation protein [Saprospiraceae bacterium]|nr:sporulation protein [Saprospiraceae bacterium]